MWPNRLRASGMGFSYGVGNLGKIIGPLGLTLIAGSSDLVCYGLHRRLTSGGLARTRDPKAERYPHRSAARSR